MALSCSFETDSTNYSCNVRDHQFPHYHYEPRFGGEHKEGKTDNDVTKIQFSSCVVKKVPQGLTKQFPNLKIFEIIGCELENVSQRDLIEYKNVKEFNLSGNKIEYLTGELFEDFKNLERLDFSENPLQIVEPNILDGLNKLSYGNFTIKFGSFNGVDKYSKNKIKNHLLNVFVKNDSGIVTKFIIKIQFKIQETNKKLKHDKVPEQLEVQPVVNKKPKSVCSDLRKFIQDETTKDFKIVIEDQEFPVHKFLLAARSPTLAEILKANPEVKHLNLVDISVEISEIILKFLYTDELPGNDGTNFLHLFAAAGMLKIEDLKGFAALKLTDKINQDNVLEIFKLSIKYEEEELRQKAFDELKRYHQNYKLKDEWIVKPEIVITAIEHFKKAEEAIRKLEEEFGNAKTDN